MTCNLMSRLRALLASLSLVLAGAAAAVDISQVPIDGISNVKPNILFAMDDSGSMDFEVLLRTNDGALWWQNSGTSGTAWDAAGAPLFNSAGQATTTWTKYAYLFPNGCAADRRVLCDSGGHFAIPPTPQFASLRSNAYNPLYYDPRITYSPWLPGNISGTTRTFSAAQAAAPLSHPVRSASAITGFGLNINYTSTVANFVFRLMPGMVLPGNLISGIRTATAASPTSWVLLSTNLTVTSANVATYTWASIPYYPATYYEPETCTPSGLTCVQAPDGKTLRRYEIRAGNSFPSGRTYEAELQNFANWFQYYRKRKLMLGAAMGQVLTGITNVRGAVVGFNSNQPSAVSMLDFDAATDSLNDKALIGQFYINPSSGGTPTRETLNYVGGQFRTNSNIIQYACQRNAAFVVTDGFGEATSIAPPSYDRTRWASPSPLGVPYTGTLADMGLALFTINPRPDLPTGRVPYDPTDTTAGADRNPDLHVNTYAITLGARGTIWPSANDPFLVPPTFPNPSISRSPTSIDDLWLATLNGRGQMLLADDIQALTQGIQDVINDILYKSGSQSAVGLVNPNVTYGSNTVYWSSYNGKGWSGDVNAGPIDLVTGQVNTATQWSAAQRLDARDWSTRRIASFNGSQGVPFTAAAIGGLLGGGPAVTTQQLLDFLRGDRSLEGSSLRRRTSRLGDIVNAEPVEHPNGAVVFQAANDGMLHAFRASDGEELWAYVPGGVLSGLGALANKVYSHRFFVDGTPTVQKIDSDRTLLVGGLRAGGTGFYALDVSDPSASTDAQVAAKVLWEFPNAGTPASIRSTLGMSFSRPSIIKTATQGWVVLISSGYNTSGDGKGRVYMLNALTGSVLREFVTSAVADLGPISAFVQTESGVATARLAYAGDLSGNLWRFDLETGAVSRLATLKDAAGLPQPITAAPELTLLRKQRVVLVGTGKLLGLSDFSGTQVQSFYAIRDDGTEVLNPRTELDARTLTVSGDTRTVSAVAPNWTTRRGWYFDLPAGEVANTDPLIAQGAVFFTANKPSVVACASQSYLYMVDIESGSQRRPEVFTGTAWTGKLIGSVLSSRVVLAKLPSLSLVALIHQSDNSISSLLLKPPRATQPRKAAWREIRR